MVPLFNKFCIKIEQSKLVEKFGEVFDFAENVAFIFIRHITQLVQSSPAAVLEYLR